MEANCKTRLANVLIWLLAAKTVCSAPTPTQSSGVSESTQYPPFTQGARLLPPETQGFYPTKLEREGHELEQPTPTPSDESFGGLNDLLDTLGQPESLLNWLLPNPDEPADVPSQPPAAPTSETSSTPPVAATPAPTTLASTHGIIEQPTTVSSLPSSFETTTVTTSSSEENSPVASTFTTQIQGV
jgi:endo-1,3(4)-beta-glucanase